MANKLIFLDDEAVAQGIKHILRIREPYHNLRSSNWFLCMMLSTSVAQYQSTLMGKVILEQKLRGYINSTQRRLFDEN